MDFSLHDPPPALRFGNLGHASDLRELEYDLDVVGRPLQGLLEALRLLAARDEAREPGAVGLDQRLRRLVPVALVRVDAADE
jgi:hypothetical protein